MSQRLWSHGGSTRRGQRRQERSMPDKVRIALDAMGGDHGAPVILPGADISLTRHPDIEFLLFGNSAAVQPVLDKLPRLKARSKVVHTEVAIRMDDKPSQALRYGRWKSVSHMLVAMVTIQGTLGVLTLLTHVPVTLATVHQAGSLTLLSIAIWFLHVTRRPTAAKHLATVLKQQLKKQALVRK
jgi:hypothetical protein